MKIIVNVQPKISWSQRRVQVGAVEASRVTCVDVSRLALRWPDALRWAVHTCWILSGWKPGLQGNGRRKWKVEKVANSYIICLMFMACGVSLFNMFVCTSLSLPVQVAHSMPARGFLSFIFTFCFLLLSSFSSWRSFMHKGLSNITWNQCHD